MNKNKTILGFLCVFVALWLLKFDIRMALGVFFLFEGINLLKDLFKDTIDKLFMLVGFWLFVLKKDVDESEFRQC